MSRSPAFTRSPSLTVTSMTRPATLGARSTSGASTRPFRSTTWGSSAGLHATAPTTRTRGSQSFDVITLLCHEPQSHRDAENHRLRASKSLWLVRVEDVRSRFPIPGRLLELHVAIAE